MILPSPTATTGDADPARAAPSTEGLPRGRRFPLALLRRLGLAVVAMLLTASTGCSTLLHHTAYNQSVDEAVFGWRNHLRARRAWHARKEHHACHPHLHDLGRGFRAGYREAASGGNGCVPPLPHRRYWSWRYNSLKGQEQIHAWFEGYPLGVQAAEEEGVVYFAQIPVSHAAEVQHQQHHPHAPFYNSPVMLPPTNPALQMTTPVEILPPEIQGRPAPSSLAPPRRDPGPDLLPLPAAPPPRPTSANDAGREQTPTASGASAPPVHSPPAQLVHHVESPPYFAPKPKFAAMSPSPDPGSPSADEKFSQNVSRIGEYGFSDPPLADEPQRATPWSSASAAAENLGQRLHEKWSSLSDKPLLSR